MFAYKVVEEVADGVDKENAFSIDPSCWMSVGPAFAIASARSLAVDSADLVPKETLLA